ncbi:hypothetical protein [Tabrizicola sp. TH137]|uniref:hypothetical protein n=1 Tax=Tabrizicola sp. TH137 TaxID=2067452 RepID=UPI0011800E45|nr:hypothetical protein [Tabrizicola sp. TH137]
MTQIADNTASGSPAAAPALQRHAATAARGRRPTLGLTFPRALSGCKTAVLPRIAATEAAHD